MFTWKLIFSLNTSKGEFVMQLFNREEKHLKKFMVITEQKPLKEPSFQYIMPLFTSHIFVLKRVAEGT